MRGLKITIIFKIIVTILFRVIPSERAETCVVQREFGTSDHGPVIATFRDA